MEIYWLKSFIIFINFFSPIYRMQQKDLKLRYTRYIYIFHVHVYQSIIFISLFLHFFLRNL